MLKYFLILVAVCLPFSLQAQTEASDINVVIFAPKAEDKPAAAMLPSCNQASMLAAVAAEIGEYQQAHPANSIISRRKQALMIKNLKDFEEIPVANFDNSANYEVARELVMTKVNYRISEENLRLCRGNSDIYLLIYPEGHGFRVQILNFIPAAASGNEFSIFYVDEQPETKNDVAEENVAAGNTVPAAETAETPVTETEKTAE